MELPRGQRVPAQWARPPFAASRSSTYLASVYDHYAALSPGQGTDGRAPSGHVISFNYDLVLEQALRTVGARFNYGLRRSAVDFDESVGWIRRRYSQGGLTLLKLHGSMNWVGSVRSSPSSSPSQRERHPRDSRGRALHRQAQHLRHIRSVRTAGWTPVLVPPTWRKTFGALLSPIWDAAVQAIRAATRIIVIGYSSADQHFRYLLAAGSMDNRALESVWFVTPDQNNDLWKQAASLFHQGADGTGIGTRLVPVLRPAMEFLFDAESLESINRVDSGLNARLKATE